MKPAEWLLAVRRGEVAFEEWWSRSLELDAELEAMAEEIRSRPGQIGEPSRMVGPDYFQFWRRNSLLPEGCTRRRDGGRRMQRRLSPMWRMFHLVSDSGAVTIVGHTPRKVASCLTLLPSSGDSET